MKKLDLSNVTKKYCYKTLFFNDLIGRIIPMLEKSGWEIRVEDGKVTKMVRQDHKTSWVFVKRCKERQCALKYSVLLAQFGVIHSECYNCWKVVVRPRNVKELFMMKDLMEYMDRNGKLGRDERPWTSGLYGAYFYTDSYEEGLFRLNEVRKNVAKHISPHISVKLKRGCTEMESKRGPSNTWKYTNDDLYWQRRVEDKFDIPNHDFPQDKDVQIYVMRQWLEKAWKEGDRDNFREFNWGMDLVTDLISYDVGKAEPDSPKMPTPGINLSLTREVKPNGKDNDNGNNDSVPTEIGGGRSDNRN